jgi:hypothetical protein
MVHLSWKQLAAAIFTLAVAVAGATFGIVQLATNSYVSALQLQVTLLDNRVRELQQEGSSLEPAVSVPQTPSVSTVVEAANGGKVVAVSFEQPATGAKVPQFVDVKYSIAGAVPSSYLPVLFVRDPLGQYWCWGTSSSGLHRRVQIGVATDKGQAFEIGVLVTKDKIGFGEVSQVLPEGIAYQSVEVTRE